LNVKGVRDTQLLWPHQIMYFAVFVIDPLMNALSILGYVVGVVLRKSEGIVAKDVVLMITHIRHNIIIFIVITAKIII